MLETIIVIAVVVGVGFFIARKTKKDSTKTGTSSGTGDSSGSTGGGGSKGTGQNTKIK